MISCLSYVEEVTGVFFNSNTVMNPFSIGLIICVMKSLKRIQKASQEKLTFRFF